MTAMLFLTKKTAECWVHCWDIMVKQPVFYSPQARGIFSHFHNSRCWNSHQFLVHSVIPLMLQKMITMLSIFLFCCMVFLSLGCLHVRTVAALSPGHNHRLSCHNQLWTWTRRFCHDSGCWSSVQTSTFCCIWSVVRTLGINLVGRWSMQSSSMRVFWLVSKPVPTATESSDIRHQFS